MEIRQENDLVTSLNSIASELSLIGASKNLDDRYIGMYDAMLDTIRHLQIAMFPFHFGSARERFSESEKRVWELMRSYDALCRVLTFVTDNVSKAQEEASSLLGKLPEIMEYLKTDIQAAYEGDPAAVSQDEVILTYPAFTAISIYRIAHQLYLRHIPILPRMMTEYAHQLTGIDIHPGASIGKYFFIDHGTGVVIGETTTIGEHVKLYQHVTLGAKSFDVSDDGTLVKGIKRHPDIGNYVVIYAGATILGGTTRIGDHCVVGGNVWLTHSLEEGETATIRVIEQKQK